MRKIENFAEIILCCLQDIEDRNTLFVSLLRNKLHRRCKIFFWLISNTKFFWFLFFCQSDFCQKLWVKNFYRNFFYLMRSLLLRGVKIVSVQSSKNHMNNLPFVYSLFHSLEFLLTMKSKLFTTQKTKPWNASNSHDFFISLTLR